MEDGAASQAFETDRRHGLPGEAPSSLATGGASYPRHRLDRRRRIGFARQRGPHGCAAAGPSLVRARVAGRATARQMLVGLSLRNVQRDRAMRTAKRSRSTTDFGELLFTHFGLSGPTDPVRQRAYAAHFGSKAVHVSRSTSSRRWTKRRSTSVCSRDFEKHKNRDFINALGELLPQKLIPVVVRPIAASTAREEKVNAITTRSSAPRCCAVLKALSGRDFRLAARSPSAIVTAGGVSVREVDPKTMRVRKAARTCILQVRCIDVDAYTGGFNLQIAWSTGYAAGMSVG